MRRYFKTAAVVTSLTVAASGLAWTILSAQGPAPWVPPAPSEPDDTIYASPYTFDSTADAGSDEADDAGAAARIAARWELTGGPASLSINEGMAQEAAADRELYGLQLPGGAGAPLAPAWQSLGPTKGNHWQNGTQPNPQINSGRLNAILVNPSNPDTVYVIAATGGLWKTTNFSSPGPRWRAMSDNIGTDGVGGGALGKNPDTIYLGTGDPFDSAFGGYMVRSLDGGQTWGPAHQLTASATLDVKVDTSAAADIVLVGTNNGLFRSTDGGSTYSAAAFAGSSVWSLAQTSAGWLAVAESNATGQARLFVSTNKGAAWAPIPNGGNVFAGAGRTTLGVGAAGDAVVYAYASTTGDQAQLDLFRSIDGGLNWSAIGLAGKHPTNFDFFQQDMDLMGGQAFYNQMVLVDPTDANRNTVYLGGQLSSAKTTDGGATWLLTSTWVPLRGPAAVVGDVPYVHADFHCAAFAINGRNAYVMVGSDGGLFVSRNAGRTWDDTKNEGLTTHQIYAMSVNATHPEELLVGLQDNGTLYRQPNTTIYNGVIGGDGFGAGWSQANNAVSLGSVYFSSIRRVVNNPPNVQNKFSAAYAGIVRSEAGFFTPLTTPTAAADPTGLKFFTYTRTRIYSTSDGAGSWATIGRSGVNIPMPAGLFFQGQHGLGVSPTDVNRVSATAGSGRVAITTDGGATWIVKALLSLMPTYGGINIASAWGGSQVVYVGSGSTNTARRHVVKSDDAGQTWHLADGGLPRLPVNKIVVDPGDASGNTAYLANVIGVYRTTDGGTSWTRFGNGLPQAEFKDLYLAADGSFLRAASYGRGVWQIALK